MHHNQQIEKLAEAIKAVHGCDARHLSTNRVKAVIEGKTAWEGEVETFELSGHPKAKRCHAWGYVDDGQFKSTAVLELPPVDSPSTAVDVAISAKGRKL